MNNQLQEYARLQLNEGLAKLQPSHHRIFKLMYGRNNGRRSLDDTLALTVAEVIEEMPPEKLSWAMEQVQRSLDVLEKEANQ